MAAPLLAIDRRCGCIEHFDDRGAYESRPST